MANPLFARKPLSLLLEELKGENRLRRVLGPVQLTSLGVGAVIGAGIFVTTGAIARQTTGPALMLSYVVAGLVCVLAALCYAEFASMVPVAGSAYTYAYATLGELFAWIIGWDLILEYAVSSATVADGWSGYFQNILGVFGIELPRAISGPVVNYDPAAGGLVATGSFINLPAVLIVALVTVTAGFAVASFSWVIVALVPSWQAVVVAMSIFALGEAMQAPRFYEYVADLAPRDRVGTFMGFAFLPVAIGSFVGGPLGGWLVEKCVRGPHPSSMGWWIAGIGFVSTVMMLLYDRAAKGAEA